MKYYLSHVALLAVLVMLFYSCKKTKATEPNCFSSDTTTRQIVDKQALIKLTNGKYYILEQGTIDSKLIPCNLAQAFQVNNLQVIISGDVKATVRPPLEPCCSENFVIKKIEK